MTHTTRLTTHEQHQQRCARARQRTLGKTLADLYASVTIEPLPNQFMELLARIDAMPARGPTA